MPRPDSGSLVVADPQDSDSVWMRIPFTTRLVDIRPILYWFFRRGKRTKTVGVVEQRPKSYRHFVKPQAVADFRPSMTIIEEMILEPEAIAQREVLLAEQIAKQMSLDDQKHKIHALKKKVITTDMTAYDRLVEINAMKKPLKLHSDVLLEKYRRNTCGNCGSTMEFVTLQRKKCPKCRFTSAIEYTSDKSHRYVHSYFPDGKSVTSEDFQYAKDRHEATTKTAEVPLWYSNLLVKHYHDDLCPNCNDGSKLKSVAPLNKSKYRAKKICPKCNFKAAQVFSDILNEQHIRFYFPNGMEFVSYNLSTQESRTSNTSDEDLSKWTFDNDDCDL